jgi:prephenate dehydrogenase
MAGKETSGIQSASSELFNGANLVMTLNEQTNTEALQEIKTLANAMRFGRIVECSAEEHDRKIAFTSQLAHIVSNAYIKSPSSSQRKGISAGSYKDLTRVAYLNENMWTELFLENKDNLIFELDFLIEELKKYSDAMKNDDAVLLKQLLKDGREAKEKAD